VDDGDPRRARDRLRSSGVSSLFLAGLILLLPHADRDVVVRVIATYAQVFGSVLLVAAMFFGRDEAAAGLSLRRS